MTRHFAKFGVSFQYPENWTLDEEDALAGNRSVTVLSPDGYVFWSLALRDKENDPAQLVQGIVDTMRQEYDTLESYETTQVVGEHKMQGVDMHFYCTDMIGTARAHWVKTDQCIIVIYVQGEDRAFDRAEEVLRAMTTSLLTGVKNLRFHWEEKG